MGKKNYDKIKETFSKLDQSEGCSFSQGIWSLKNKTFPKVSASVPAAKKDVTNRLVTDPAGLIKLYKDTFTHRLRERPSKESYHELFELQESLLRKRLAITKTKKSAPWTEKNVIEVMKTLKNNKSKDPHGMINELFKFPNAGSDLIKSITVLMNRCKDQCIIPSLYRFKNVSAIHKNRGSKLDLNNDRGIMTTTILNSILQKLLYKDIYPVVDENMTDSNVGARRGRNIRNHTFVVNSIIHDAAVKKTKPVDFAIMDFKMAFDILSPTTVNNDLYDLGIRNNELNLIHESDKVSHIAVKTPVGITERVTCQNCVAQGDVLAPLKCCVCVDKMAETHAENLSGHLYKYKNVVSIPPLTMVDDTIIASDCGPYSAMATAHHNSMTNLKKLQFGEQKCIKMHVGCRNMICPQNVIDTWGVKGDEDTKTILDLADVEGDPHSMEMKDNWKYLGDILSSDGKNDANIKERVQRGLGAVTNICQTLSDLCLGPYYYEAAIIMRSSLLLSTILSNSEAWVNLTKVNVEELEAIDEKFLRDIFGGAHSKTPIETLYLETGCVPIRFILKSRRLNFLHYILSDKEDSLLSKVFRAQCEKPVRGDWVNTVRNDLEELNLNLDFEQIKSNTKESFKRIVKEHVNAEAFKYLKNLQQTHSKARPIQYSNLSLQSYLKADSDMTTKEKSFTFSIRTRMIDLKSNFKEGQKNLNCRLCDKHEETQQNLLICTALDTDEPVNANYSDLFCAEKGKIYNISMLLKKKFEMFQHIQVQGKRNTSSHPSAALHINVNNVSHDSKDMG